jgi:hypothetical protein
MFPLFSDIAEDIFQERPENPEGDLHPRQANKDDCHEKDEH